MYYTTELKFEDGSCEGCGSATFEEALAILYSDIETNKHKKYTQAYIYKWTDGVKNLICSLRILAK